MCSPALSWSCKPSKEEDQRRESQPQSHLHWGNLGYRQDQLLLQRQLSGKSFHLIVPMIQLRLTALQLRRANKPCDVQAVQTGQIPVGNSSDPCPGAVPGCGSIRGLEQNGWRIMQWCSSSSAQNSQFILTMARWCMSEHGMKFDNRIYGELAQIWSSQARAQHTFHTLPLFFLIPSLSTHGNMQIRPVLIAEVFI